MENQTYTLPNEQKVGGINWSEFLNLPLKESTKKTITSGDLRGNSFVQELLEKATIGSLVTSLSGVCGQASDQLKKALRAKDHKVMKVEANPFSLDFSLAYPAHVFLIVNSADDQSIVLVDPTWRQFETCVPKTLNLQEITNLKENKGDTWDLAPEEFSDVLVLKIEEIQEKFNSAQSDQERQFLLCPSTLLVEIPKELSYQEQVTLLVSKLKEIPQIQEWTYIYWIEGLLQYPISRLEKEEKKEEGKIDSYKNLHIFEKINNKIKKIESFLEEQKAYYKMLKEEAVHNETLKAEREKRQKRFEDSLANPPADLDS